MRISASVITHPGNRREKNEDNFCFNGKNIANGKNKKTLKKTTKINQPVFMGIFDGMGGISAGERASLIASNIAKGVNFGAGLQNDVGQIMIEICKKANEITCKEMVETKKRMGTTASMLCFDNSGFTLCNIGDSPVFIFRDGWLQEISHEHTEKENFIKIHGIENLPKKKKYKLTQHIGIFPEELEIEPYLYTDSFCDGDRFIICSDGLTDMVDEEDIVKILEERKSPAKTVKNLLSVALENGGKDNITIVCADVK